MKKMRKHVAFLLSVLMSLSLMACGSTSATTDSAPAQVDEPKVEVEVEAQKEESVTAEPVEEVKVDESSTVTTEETDTPEEEPVIEEPVEEEPEPPTFDQLIQENEAGSYVNDGVFDIKAYGTATNAEVYITKNDFAYVYDNDWYVQAGANPDYPGMSFITIGDWDSSGKYDRWNVATYSYIFEFGEGMDTTGGFSVSKEILAYLPSIITAMKANPDPTVAPDVSGTVFKPCEYNDAFVQH